MGTTRMPVLFMGHGSPMNAIEDNEFSQAWSATAAGLPRPQAILCVSAHWETRGPAVTSMTQPRTIHDFFGFPPELYAVQYPAPGSPELARRTGDLLDGAHISMDTSWGLDHGAWSVLKRMYPAADIPVVQLSLDRTQDPPAHYELGRRLAPLRDEGVLIVGSGNIVHNLRLMAWQDIAYEWARDFDLLVKGWIETGDHQPIIHYEQHGQGALLSVNTAEHYLPLLYVLGAQQPGEPVSFFAEKVWGGSISMRCVKIGPA